MAYVQSRAGKSTSQPPSESYQVRQRVRPEPGDAPRNHPQTMHYGINERSPEDVRATGENERSGRQRHEIMVR